MATHRHLFGLRQMSMTDLDWSSFPAPYSCHNPPSTSRTVQAANISTGRRGFPVGQDAWARTAPGQELQNACGTSQGVSVARDARMLTPSLTGLEGRNLTNQKAVSRGLLWHGRRNERRMKPQQGQNCRHLDENATRKIPPPKGSVLHGMMWC